jgi:hypothetical protein
MILSYPMAFDASLATAPFLERCLLPVSIYSATLGGILVFLPPRQSANGIVQQ